MRGSCAAQVLSDFQKTNGSADLKVPVDDPVSFKVVIVLSKRIDELLCYLTTQEQNAVT